MSMEPEGWYLDAVHHRDAEAKTFSFLLRKLGREPVMCVLATGCVGGCRSIERPLRAGIEPDI